METTRLLSLIAVLGVAVGLVGLLFHDVEAVRIDVDVPPSIGRDASMDFDVRIAIPPGQRLPVAGVTIVLESTGRVSRAVVDEAACGDPACTSTIWHDPRTTPVVADIERSHASADPTEGPLWVRVEGYGRSAMTGYGEEVEPSRRRQASDIVSADGRPSYGLGFGGPEGASLAYRVFIDEGALEVGGYFVTFIVETGSESMGGISSRAVPLRVM